jgi:predicted unusual protein kinase regulating ubiquinone biosynthesis (AarF/ABC1/UbiB family)
VVAGAASTERVAASLRQAASAATQVEVLLPAVVRASEKVLVLQYFDAIRLNDRAALDQHGVDRQRLVEVICRAYARQIYVDGFFNADESAAVHSTRLCRVLADISKLSSTLVSGTPVSR